MKHEIHHWVTFLNQPTGVYIGSEKLAKKLDLVVFYCEIMPDKPGKYQFEIKLITDNATTTPEHYITNTFFQMLEDSISKQPAYWLWSHRRWKHTPHNTPNII
jgi:Kdo2-lipid IVA lauroyltransferase/acyltransferase